MEKLIVSILTSAHRIQRQARKMLPVRAQSIAACMLGWAVIFGAPRARGQTASDVWQDANEATFAAAKRGPASERTVVPANYRTVRLNWNAFRAAVATAPAEFTKAGQPPAELSLPMPDGTFARFTVEESPIMEPALAAKFPDIKTYVGRGIDNPLLSARIDQTPQGFHAIVFTGSGSIYIDPYWRDDTTNYLSYRRRDFSDPAKKLQCLIAEGDQDPIAPGLRAAEAARPTGASLRTYRLAVACTGEYATAAGGGTLNGTFGAIVTTVNRVSALYERDFAIRLKLVTNEDQIIFLDPVTDGFTNGTAGSLINESQTKIDAVIGTANYDIGHTFSTGAGGLAGLGVVGRAGQKARGVTGTSNPVGDPYDIDYVAHEMGHQFGANHPFNATSGSCSSSNRNGPTAYELGSGTTIMAYAGICAPQDLAPHSDDYFHTVSYDEIDTYTTTGAGNVGVPTATGNTPPTISALTSYTIPQQTPFAITAVATDPDVGDVLTYCWEEFDLGAAQDPTAAPRDNGASPIFRSYDPSPKPTRLFPSLTYILNNANVPPPTVSTYASGEFLPITNRTMTFRATVRDNRPGGGGSNYASTTVTSTIAAGPFAITSQNSAATIAGGSVQAVTWSVANTTAAPVSCANVKISLSTDGGNTYPFVLAASTPNSGSANVTIPNTANVATTQGRIKVEAVGNIFFDVSNAPLTVTSTNTAPTLTITGSVTVQRGTPTPTVATVATVADTNTPVTVAITDAPADTVITASISGSNVNVSARADSSLVTTLTTRTYPVILTVTDSLGSTTSGTFNLIVQPNPAPTLGNYTDQSVPRNSSVTATPSAPPADANNNLGASPASVFPTTLPGGGTVTVNQITGAVTATTIPASTPGTYVIRVTVQDTSGAAVVKSFNLTILATVIDVAPTVTTPTSAGSTQTDATLGGNVTSDGGQPITERGVVYSLTAVNANPLIGGTGVTQVTSAGTTGVFTVNATGLTSGSGYSFKAYATNSIGTTYTTPVSTFTQGTPNVTTPTSASITATSATLGGNVTSDAGSAITERGVVYAVTSVNGNPQIGGTGVTKVTNAGTTGVFTVNATGLTNNTGYSFRAYATNSAGTTYTTPVSNFTTLAVAPTVTTPTQTAITQTNATLGGNVTGDGGAAITERGVVFSITTVNANPLIGGSGVTKLTSAGTTGVFTVSATGLTQGTGYSFKAYATNTIGTTYTTPVSTFTTLVAVPLTGTKTVGTGGNYTSLTNAGGLFEAINGNGVNGALSVQITSDLNSETGTVALNAMTGTTPSLMIFPSGAVRVISGSIAGVLVRLNGADNVTLDGSLGGTGTDRSLTITNPSTTSPTVIALVSLGTGLGATNDVIKNCNISTGVATTLGYGIAVGGGTPGTSGADNDNVTIQNNSITAAPVGIYAAGTASVATGGDDNLSIIGNSIAYNSTLASIGIQVGNARNSSVSQNTVSEQTSSSGASTAISIETGFVSSTVTRNTVSKSLTTSSGGWGSRGITVGTGTTASALTIANNVVYGVNGSNWSSFGGSSSMGITIGTIGNSSVLTTTTGGVNLYFNSVNMAGSMGTGSTTALTTAIYIGSAVSALDLRNNVFVNTQVGTSTTQKNYAIYSAATITAFTTIDYNDYFVSNTFNAASAIPGFLTSDRVNLAGIQAGFGQNTHSFTGDPLFTSATDLHITSVLSPTSNAGTPIGGITTDIDGGTRSASTPDIGADEFVSLPLVTTPTQTAITASSATLGGNVTGDGGTAITERGVVYTITATNGNPLIGGTGVTKVTSAGTTGVFTANATGLSAGTGYSFKAYAINSVGTTYTTPVSTFTTLTLQEAWRQTSFGITTNTGNAADTADPDGDGLTNLFEYVAGLVPTNPASRFSVRIEAVVGQSGQKAVIFSPVVAGRTYVVKSKASLSDATWMPLGSLSTGDNGAERTVTDLSATGATKFYQVEITLP